MRFVPLFALALAGSSSLAAPTSYRFRLIDNLVFVPAKVAGHVGWAVLDTGTSGVAIDQSFAARVGVAKGKALGKADTSGSEDVPIWQAKIPSLRLPGIGLREVPAIMLDTGPYTKTAGFPVDLLVGLPFFEHRIASFDYPREVMRVATDSTARLSCRTPIAFRLVDGTPVVDAHARFEGDDTPRPISLMVDLGTRHSAMLLGGSFLATPPGARLQAKAAPRQVASGAGGAVMGWSSTATSLTIGATTFRDVPFAASSQLNSSEKPPYDGTLGAPFWTEGTIAFDYDRKLLCLPEGGARILPNAT